MTSSEHSLWTEGFQKWLNGQMDRLVVGQVVESETGIGWRLNRLRDPEPQGAYQLMG
jgi:hypothetical protein